MVIAGPAQASPPVAAICRGASFIGGKAAMGKRKEHYYFPFPETWGAGGGVSDGEAIVRLGFFHDGVGYHTAIDVSDARAIADMILQSAEPATAELMSAA